MSHSDMFQAAFNDNPRLFSRFGNYVGIADRYRFRSSARSTIVLQIQSFLDQLAPRVSVVALKVSLYTTRNFGHAPEAAAVRPALLRQNEILRNAFHLW